jgi:DNA-binding MarR family transcriptional regulator
MAAIERATRTISEQNLVISQAIAERLGINASDLECLNLARAAQDSGISAGELASSTGLTSGAITGVIDRLERADLVRRERGATDRRKVIVRPTPCVEKTIPPLFEPLHREMTAMWASYSGSQLKLILDFLTRVRDVMRDEGIALRNAQRRDTKAQSGKPPPEKSAKTRSPPHEAARL